jgi:hypothetical protein
MKKVALVTGASAGIGEATVKRLIEQGHTTYAAARRLDRMASLEKLGGRSYCHSTSPMTAPSSRRPHESAPNKAASMSLSTTPATPPTERWKTSPSTKRAVGSRSMFLALPASSSCHTAHAAAAVREGSECVVDWRQRMGATRGLVPRDQIRRGGFSDCLRMELKPFGIDVIVIEPGAIRTEWTQITLDTLLQASGHNVYGPQADEKRALFLGAADSASDPGVVAREIVKAIQATRPKTRYAVGAYAKPMVFMSTFLPDRFNDWLMGTISKSLLKQQQKKSATQTA